MSKGSRLINNSLDRPAVVTWLMIGVAVVIALAAALPSLPADWPVIAQLQPVLRKMHRIRVDTDPENMLSPDEPVRVFHDEMKKTLDLHDMVVIGVVNDENPNGMFNPASLKKVHALTAYAKTLRGAVIGEPEGQGVIVKDIIALSTVDNIEPSSAGVKFSWLMRQPPQTEQEALKIGQNARRVPFLDGTVVSDKPGREGKAVAIYLPLTRKDLSHKIYLRIRKKADELGGPEKFYITGLPVAEDTFGVEMFIQMAISAPAAMLVIFVLMLAFFRKLLLVISPMIVAMVSVILTMGALIIAGFPVHIMSSMIPIFIMPIAVLDSIHIISEFFEKYQLTRDRKKTIRTVMDDLFMPMLYTSLTSAAGFASLALTPIPPVQVFGMFVAMGIMVAWLLTVTFIPAYIMFISPRKLENFGAVHREGRHAHETMLTKFLRWTGSMTYRRAKPILAITMVVLVIAGWGISRINVNDNPVKWFAPSHPIRVADRVLNDHFGGTYMAYLALRVPEKEFRNDQQREQFVKQFASAVSERAETLKGENPAVTRVFEELANSARTLVRKAKIPSEVLKSLAETIERKQGQVGEPSAAPIESGPPALPGGLDVSGEGPTVPTPAKQDQLVKSAWRSAGLFISEQVQDGEIFKRPDVLEYIIQIQNHFKSGGTVGKTNSLADIVRTVRRDFVSGKQEDYRIPASKSAVGQMLVQFQSSHRKDDLWHFATKDYRTTSIWLQLTSGDNRNMSRIVRNLEKFMRQTPPPVPMEVNWFGLTYINIEWQARMVWGMFNAFAGSFLVVFLLMTILFRSALWGLLSMIPLTVTIGAIYGAIGLIGKDYDMPVAVLSSLTLGLAVDFAIHFLARARAMQRKYGSWEKTSGAVFGEPARAIMRNIIVIAAGFLPLLLAPLVPYQTVGALLAIILLTSGVGTLLLLPAMIRLIEKPLFNPKGKTGVTCSCVTCIISAAALFALIMVNLHMYIPLGGNVMWIVAVIVVAVSAVGCRLLSNRQACTHDSAGNREGVSK